MLLAINADCLTAVVEAVDPGDMLPLALTCVTLRDACVLRADAIRVDGAPRWVTDAASSVARVKWATGVMSATPTIQWCRAAAKHGNKTLLIYLRSWFQLPLDSTVMASGRLPLRAAMLT